MNRCINCPWCKVIYANGQWSYFGCTHEPNQGKWVVEIKDCPIVWNELGEDE